ncbi:MAG: Uma2 family endonuclease [Clostridiales bacterium]|nr:Uma2 family endonuclease [Clostridiales bacterium]
MENDRYTYSDYASWDDEKRCELIDGVIFLMSPEPTPEHQRVVGSLFFQLHLFLRGKPCEAFIAPLDVRLNAASGDDTVVQPDILIVCDKAKIEGKSCKGVPDMVVEVLSPSTLSRDRVLKFNKYLQAGVREYWIVDPDGKKVAVNILKNGEYVNKAYGEEETVPVNVLEGCRIDLREVF